jgi:hypothetical protein
MGTLGIITAVFGEDEAFMFTEDNTGHTIFVHSIDGKPSTRQELESVNTHIYYEVIEDNYKGIGLLVRISTKASD